MVVRPVIEPPDGWHWVDYERPALYRDDKLQYLDIVNGRLLTGDGRIPRIASALFMQRYKELIEDAD